MTNCCQKKTIIAQKHLFLVQNYTIHSKNTQLLLKYTTFLPKIPNFCGKKPISSKNIPILATQRDTNLASNNHFHHNVAKFGQKIRKL